jgi:glyoxylase-like metal-dependent hydrolase (beta-lactamase superfamily II)
MGDVELIWSDAHFEVHRFVEGPVENNVYVVRCRRSGEATLIDAANEHERLLATAARLGVTSVLETHVSRVNFSGEVSRKPGAIQVEVET